MSAPGHSSQFATMARKRDLWWQFTVRAVEIRHRGSYLGMLWAVLNPLLMLGVYFTVFALIFGGHFGEVANETKVDFALAMFLGILLFNVIAETLAVSPTVIVGNPNLVKKVVFPLDVLPVSQLGAGWFHLIVSLALLLLGALFLGRGLTLASVLWIPAILAPLVLLSVGLSWLFAALGVFFRDITQVTQPLTQVVMYASAVFYPQSMVSKYVVAWRILRLNPFLQTVELARRAVLWNLPVSTFWLGYTYVWGIAVFFFGRWLFRRLQPAFADVI